MLSQHFTLEVNTKQLFYQDLWWVLVLSSLHWQRTTAGDPFVRASTQTPALQWYQRPGPEDVGMGHRAGAELLFMRVNKSAAVHRVSSVLVSFPWEGARCTERLSKKGAIFTSSAGETSLWGTKWGSDLKNVNRSTKNGLFAAKFCKICKGKWRGLRLPLNAHRPCTLTSSTAAERSQIPLRKGTSSALLASCPTLGACTWVSAIIM